MVPGISKIIPCCGTGSADYFGFLFYSRELLSESWVRSGLPMKVSEYLRRYQISGRIPDDRGDEMLCFWTGWLIGTARRGETSLNFDDAREMAIKAAEFIEAHAKE